MKTTNRKTITEEITGTVSEIITQVKKLIKKGNARRVIIQNKERKVLFQSQLTVGVAGTVMLTVISPIVSAISLFALFMNDVKVIVERYPDEEGETDDYEVEAEFIEIRDEEEGTKDESTEKKNEKKTETDKTVGKDDSDQ